LAKKKKTLRTPPTTTTKKRRRETPSLHDSISHWLHGNSIPKIGGHYFWHGLIALPKNTLAFRYKVPDCLVTVVPKTEGLTKHEE
jgi:hypothetical protein